MAPWMIQKLREQAEEQARRDQASWERQPRLDLDLPFLTPSTPREEASPQRGVVTVDLTIP